MSDRIIFLHFLRGIACCLVVFSHMFWPDMMVANWLGLESPILNFGQIGVGVFFLVSGYVIPISCESTTANGFLLRRLFRIFPLAILTTLLIWWFDVWEFSNADVPLSAALSTAFLVYDILDEPVLRMLFWTLVIEVKFYLLFYIIKLVNPSLIVSKIFFITAIVFAGFTALMLAIPDGYYTQLIGQNILFISYIMLGSALYYKVTAKYFVMLLIFMAIGFLAMGDASYFTIVPLVAGELHYLKAQALLDYGLAFLIFYSVYRHQALDIYRNRLITWIATISYSLYITHENVNAHMHEIFAIPTLGMLGNMAINQLVAFAVSLAVAQLLYSVIERPFMAYAKRF